MKEIKMQLKIKLNSGEILRLDESKSKGTMAQTDIEYYSILNEAKEVVGKVKYEDCTSLNGLGRNQHVTQTDMNGNTIIQESW